MNFLISSLTSGGAERVVSLLANEICKTDKVTIFLIKNDIFYNVDDRIDIVNIGTSSNFLISYLHALIFLFKKIRKKEIVSLQSHMFYSNYIAGILSLIFPSFKVTMVHCVAWDSKFPKGTLSRYIHMVLMRLFYRFADKHIFKSIGMKNSYRKIIDTTNSTVIYNPVNLELINGNYHIPFSHQDEHVRILSVGRFHRSKRQKDLLKALSKVDFKFEAIFLGDGELLIEAQEYCCNLGMDKNIKFIGNVSNPYEYYRWADIYISCSDSEGFPNALIESLGCGCISIHSDCISGPDEILRKNKSISLSESVLSCPYGFLYPVGDVNSLIYALNYVVNNQSELQDNASKFNLNEINNLNISAISHEYMK